MTDRLGTIGQQYSDDAGNPLINGRLYFYDSGTLTPKDTFSDVNLTKLNTNPVLLDGAGRQPNVWFEGFAKIILTSSDEVQIEERDPIGSASGNSFSSWTSSVIYAENVFVQGSDGNFYRSLSAGNNGNDPVTDTTNWTRVQFTETWNTNDTYNIPDIVQGSDGALYVAITSSNTGNDPVGDSVNWVPVGAPAISELIETITLSTDTFIDIALPSEFIAHRIEFNVVQTSASTSLTFRTSSDGGSTFAAVSGDYWQSRHEFSSSASTDATVSSKTLTNCFISSSTQLEHNGSLDLYNANISDRFVVNSTIASRSSTNVVRCDAVCLRNSVVAVDFIRFLALTGTLNSGTIKVYGII